ncbi:MAG: M48 family metalloprotease [Elusimicrobia bacterium]|nr:M48 family metalloprotease [Elusimicrobiota bacterium]
MRRFIAAAFLAFAPTGALADEPDIAAQFLTLQERLMEAQARFTARQLESRRLAAGDWARAPGAQACAAFVAQSLKDYAGISASRDRRSREAARLIDLMSERLARGSDLRLSALCPSEIGDSPRYNARSLSAVPSARGPGDAEEALSRTAASKAVVIDRGLIMAAGSDDELAAVVGHELGHLALQHLPARRELALMGDGKSFSEGLGAPSDDISARRMRWWGEGYLIETELEADAFGAALMARAGYDPREFAAVLAKAEPTALLLDARGEAAVRRDFARRNEAAAKFAAQFPVLRPPTAPPRVLTRLKALLSSDRHP